MPRFEAAPGPQGAQGAPEPADLSVQAVQVADRLLKLGRWVSADFRVLPSEAAHLLGVSEKTLRNWRSQGHQLQPVAGPRVTYRIVDVLALAYGRAA